MVFCFNGLFPEVKQVIRNTRINVLISFHIVQLRFYQKIDHMLIQSSMLFASTHGKMWTKCWCKAVCSLPGHMAICRPHVDTKQYFFARTHVTMSTTCWYKTVCSLPGHMARSRPHVNTKQYVFCKDAWQDVDHMLIQSNMLFARPHGTMSTKCWFKAVCSLQGHMARCRPDVNTKQYVICQNTWKDIDHMLIQSRMFFARTHGKCRPNVHTRQYVLCKDTWQDVDHM